MDVARAAGAPTESAGKKCPITVEILFTNEPQALLDGVAKAYPLRLGFYPASLARQMTTFSGPVQAWYETATRSMETQLLISSTGSQANAADQSFGGGGASNAPPLLSGAQIDSAVTAMGLQPSGITGSRLTGNRLRSEFVHVLIIADSRRLARYPLKSVADYLVMVSLTRMAQLDRCAPLPSITDLLAGRMRGARGRLAHCRRSRLSEGAVLGRSGADPQSGAQRQVRDQMMRQVQRK